MLHTDYGKRLSSSSLANAGVWQLKIYFIYQDHSIVLLEDFAHRLTFNDIPLIFYFSFDIDFVENIAPKRNFWFATGLIGKAAT